MADCDVSRITQDYLLKKRVCAALKYTGNYVQWRPNETEGWYWRGIALVFTGKYLEALQAFARGEQVYEEDSEILFGQAVVNYALGNYQLGGQYMARFVNCEAYGGISDENLTGRAFMLCRAGLFTGAIQFLEYLNTNRPQRSPELDQCMVQIYGDYMNYAFKEKPRLGDRWLLLEHIEPTNEEAMIGLIRRLIGELSWGDAIFLYRKHLDSGCAACAKDKNEEACLKCISDRVLPPAHMFVPLVFLNPKDW